MSARRPRAPVGPGSHLALPHRIRFLCAYDSELCAGVRRIFVRAVASVYRRRALDRGLRNPRSGAVVFTRRFDSALRLNLHFHALWPDGAFTRAPFRRRAEFWPTDPLRDVDVERLARAVRHRILRYLRKRGKLPPRSARRRSGS